MGMESNEVGHGRTLDVTWKTVSGHRPEKFSILINFRISVYGN